MERLRPQSYVLLVLVLLFFMWGFITCMNDILIPYLKSVFHLNYKQAMIIQFAFFGAYFIGSLLYFAFSNVLGDPINKIGYKNGIIVGLFVSAVGTGIFYPAVWLHSYEVFLIGLFVMGLGFTLLQIAANPYVAIIGEPKTASSRLNMAQGFNSLGTTLAPLIGGYWVFSYSLQMQHESTRALLVPYMSFTLLFLLLAVLFIFIKLPDYKSSEPKVNFRISNFPQLYLGIIAIFMYVGAEVSIGSMLINFLKLPNIGNMNEATASKFVSLYWNGLMIGRFLGTIYLADNTLKTKLLRSFIVWFISFAFISYIHSLHIAIIYLVPMLFASFVLVLAKKPQISLTLFSLINLVLLAFVVSMSGYLVIWFVILTGLFNSIMWSNIFTLSIHNLGYYMSRASSLLVMAIVGGAILPLAMGAVADAVSIQWSYVIPIIGFAYLIFYGIKSFQLIKL